MAGRRCLVLAPHPDDEVLGCGGTIARKVRRGAHVWVTFLTDGRKGVLSPPEEAKALREAEAIRACEVLGLSRDRLFFLAYEDGRLSQHIGPAVERVRQLAEALRADELFIPYRREFHVDHQAAWMIGTICRPEGVRLYEYPIWYGPWLWSRLGWRARAAAVSHLADVIHSIKVQIVEVAEIKQRALEAYRSQVSSFESQGDWGRRYLANFSRDYELFFARQ